MASAIVQASASATEEIVDRIAELIQERSLQVGDRLPPIRELAELLGHKPTAVRDALVRAQAVGMVRVLPRTGAFVQQTSAESVAEAATDLAGDFDAFLDPDDQNIFHLLDARRVIELELGSRAIARRTMEDLLPLRQTLEAMTSIPVSERRSNYVDLDIKLHLQLARLGGNDVLTTVLRTILHRLRPYLEHLPWSEERRRETDRMHSDLYQALVDGDADTFRAVICRHQNSAYDCLMSQVLTPPRQCDEAADQSNGEHGHAS